MKNEEYLKIPAHKLPKDKRSFNEFIYTEVFKQNDILLPDFLYKVSCLWKTEKFNSFLKYIQTVEDLEYKNDNFKFVSAYYRKCLYICPGCGKESLTKYCGPKCSNSDPEVKKKKSETTMKHFGVPRFNKRYDFELLRLASKKFTSVVGGASKLLKFFRDSHTGSIISYANRRFSTGDVYRKLGFIQLGRTDVNYFYTRHNEVLTRYQCQKHKLKDLLENFDPSKTESENMRLNGYFKVFDCGNLIFALIA